MTISVLIRENNPEKNLYNEVLGKYGIKIIFPPKMDNTSTELDENISLIIFEHDGQNRDGFSFLRQKQSNNIKNAHTIITTEKPDIKDAVAFIREGAFDYLTKPISKEKIESFAHFLVESKKKTAEKPKQKSVKSEREKITGNSQKIKEIIALSCKIARGKSNVLIQGESGTGKELIARLIHQESPRANKPFIAVNCAAFPEGLLESELFGHMKGAFTGAIERKIGKMELAHGGTILFDEISEMNVQLQAKLLRAIQEKEIDPVGGKKPLSVDVRIIATANRDLKKQIEEGKFREDLYYRLNVIPIKLPPLKERKEDIAILIYHFIEKHCCENGVDKKAIADEVVDKLKQYDWPGNIRELENIIERAVIISPSDKIEMEHIFLEEDFSAQDKEAVAGLNPEKIIPGITMAEMEKQLIVKTLQEVNNNRQRAAEMLGIHVRTLRNKLNEYKKDVIK